MKGYDAITSKNSRTKRLRRGPSLVGGVTCTLLTALVVAFAVSSASAGPSDERQGQQGQHRNQQLPVTTLTPTPTPPTPTPTPVCGLAWRVVNSPNPSTFGNVLKGIAVVSANDVWAVGSFSGSTTEALTEHWDGVSWSVVSAANEPFTTEFTAVAAVSANDVWAVGRQWPTNAGSQALMEHWDGTSWSVIASPKRFDSELEGVAAVSTNDVWAAGQYFDSVSMYPQTLVEHWDGQQWSIIDSPNPRTSNVFLGVAAGAANDVWAVGFSGPNFQYTLIEHWDGTAWSVVPSPSAGSQNMLYAVSVISANDVWAVGDTYPQPLAMHWDGAQWTVTPIGANARFTGVAAIETDDVWAVGGGYNQDGVLAHWDGAQWHVQDETRGSLYATAALSASDLWAVGTADQGSTLVEHYSDPCPGSTTPTPTRVPLTATPAAGTSTPTATPGCIVHWVITGSPDLGINDNVLYSVSALAPDDAWAVGTTLDSNYISRTLIEHWDGAHWNISQSANQPSSDNYLYSVSAIAPNDVWAVGYSHLRTSFGGNFTLVEHWDGNAWTIVSSPNYGTEASYLQAVSALASNDIWAVGYWEQYQIPYIYHHTLTLHWNGVQWVLITSPNSGLNSSLSAVSGRASDDVWAVGARSDIYGSVGQTLVEHWTGSAWQIVPSPNRGSGSNGLISVASIAPDDAWAVGYSYGGYPTSLLEHWDGHAWSIQPGPDPPPYDGFPNAISGRASDDVWAVGSSVNTITGAVQTLAEHWDGAQWSVIPSPSQEGAGVNTLLGVSVVNSTNIWSVGYFNMGGNGQPKQTLAEHYTNPCVSASPTVSITPTATVTRGTASPTTCSVQFSDVSPGSTFYPYIRCLACRGIVNGYPDGTFKPNNGVTRGQLSKIVSNSAGFSDPQPTRTFQDVPLGSTFQVYIGRLASRGFINGYPCGGLGEPCVPPDNLPYFRPNNNATRGQISKIVSNAAGFSDPPSGQQFEDVAPGSTFYTYTYRLASRGVMSGYPCGGPQEPCVPPDNLPYFRPNNNATRGQTSKIVSNTFFPECEPPR